MSPLCKLNPTLMWIGLTYWVVCQWCNTQGPARNLPWWFSCKKRPNQWYFQCFCTCWRAGNTVDLVHFSRNCCGRFPGRPLAAPLLTNHTVVLLEMNYYSHDVQQGFISIYFSSSKVSLTFIHVASSLKLFAHLGCSFMCCI